jgi:hypothetical protein
MLSFVSFVSSVSTLILIATLQGVDGDRGWDVFSLDYIVEDSPISAVLTEKAIQSYLRVFNFLWRLKRVEYMLNECWKRSMIKLFKLKPVNSMQGWSFPLASRYLLKVLQLFFPRCGEANSGSSSRNASFCSIVVQLHHV